MIRSRQLQRDFLALLDPDEPQHGCTVLAKFMAAETKRRTAMAETLRQIVLDPLDWYMQECWKRYGPTCGLDSANAFRLAADDIRYRLAYQMSIYTEEIEALETKWVAFQATVGWGNWVRLEKAMPDAQRGRKIKTSASLGHAAVHGTQEEKAARWGKYLRDCVDVARANPRLGMTAVRQTVAEMNGVSLKTVARYTTDLAGILKNA